MAKAIAPLAERHQHGEAIEPASKQWSDDHGDIGAPYIIGLPLLGRLYRKGKITLNEARAGDRFHLDFAEAEGSQVAAIDLSRDVIDGPSGGRLWHRELPGISALWAREAALGALRGLSGGQNGVEVYCAWGVLGYGLSLSEWSRRCGYHRNTASRVLRKTLEVLDEHYNSLDEDCAIR